MRNIVRLNNQGQNVKVRVSLEKGLDPKKSRCYCRQSLSKYIGNDSEYFWSNVALNHPLLIRASCIIVTCLKPSALLAIQHVFICLHVNTNYYYFSKNANLTQREVWTSFLCTKYLKFYLCFSKYGPCRPNRKTAP